MAFSFGFLRNQSESSRGRLVGVRAQAHSVGYRLRAAPILTPGDSRNSVMSQVSLAQFVSLSQSRPHLLLIVRCHVHFDIFIPPTKLYSNYGTMSAKR